MASLAQTVVRWRSDFNVQIESNFSVQLIILLADGKLSFTCKKISVLFSAVVRGVGWLQINGEVPVSVHATLPLPATDRGHDDGDMPYNASAGRNNGFTYAACCCKAHPGVVKIVGIFFNNVSS